MEDKLICKICGEQLSEDSKIKYHVKYCHKLSPIEYYNKYLNKENLGKCLNCGQPTKFRGIVLGYRKYCCSKCVNTCPIKQEKSKITCLEKFGTEYVFQSQHFEDILIRDHGGRKSIFTDSVRKKISQKQSANAKERTLKIKEVVRYKYGVDNVQQIKEVKEQSKNTCLKRYGVDNPAKSQFIIDKIRDSRLSNRSIHRNYFIHEFKSNQETQFFNLFKETYPDLSIYSNCYVDDRYPFLVDFCVKELDLFIECNFYHTHNFKRFDCKNLNHQRELEELNKKAEENDYYTIIVDTWTVSDPHKYSYLDKLNSKIFFTLNEAIDWLNRKDLHLWKEKN